MSHYSHVIGILLLFTLQPLVTCGDKSESMAEWAPWSGWSRCSRPCKYGVTYRTRTCGTLTRSREDMKNNCVGQYKQYQTCNKDKKCHPDTRDIRKQQCEKFNSRLIGGRKYKWEPFYNARSQCQLNCRAKGQKYFVRLSNVVVDGTPCSENDPSLICVAGKCEKVGCDGILGSNKEFDKCGVCGGNNTTCHIISGIFTRTRLRHGYNHITRFPKGACNINVTEMYPSGNYLALRLTHSKFIVNGNWALGPSKTIEAAGTEVTYKRPDPGDIYSPVEYIHVKGPTNHSLDLLVIKQTDNRGIMYSYTIPMDDTKHAAHHNKKGHNKHKSKKNPPKLTFKEAPKYIEPEYKAFERNQVESLSGGKYQRDEEDIRRRNQQYMEKIRRQRHEARQRKQEQSQLKAAQENDLGNKGYGGRPLAAPSVGTGGTYSQGNPYFDTKDNQGVPLALNNDDSINPDSGTIPGRNVGHSGRSRQTQYIGSNSRGYSRNQYPYGSPIDQQQGSSDIYRRNQYVRQPQPVSGGLNSQALQSGGYQYPRPIRPSSLTGSAGSQYEGGYYRGTGDSRSIYDRNTVRSNPSYSGRQDAPPQPGINYGVQPGQGVQPNTPNIGAGAGNSGVSGRPSYINFNQQPVYVPPSYAGQQGVQSFQVQRSGTDQSYYYNNGVSRPATSTGSRGRPGRVTYSWKISGFTECSATCGGGTQATVIVCVKTDSQAVVTDENCPSDRKPKVRHVTCNNELCPAAWSAGNWSECSTTCGPGTKTRSVQCQRRLSADIQIGVTASLCQGQRRPDATLSCNQDKPCVRWSIGEWSKCSAECGRGQRTRSVVCLDANDNQLADNKCKGPRPSSMEICDMGSCAKTWFFTEWTTECSSTCGEGHYSRQLYCSASQHRCNSIHKPEDRKICKSDIPCGGKWFTGPWSKCSALCGEGTISRDVVCMKKSGRAMAVVGEENCLADDKPKTQKQCRRDPCLPEWYMTEWNECSRSCDTGIQTREVKCLDAKQKQSTECPLDKKPSTRQSCNSQTCDSHRKENKQGKTGKSSPDCDDIFPNCKVVVQARLCQYAYYKVNCCNSCSSHHHGNT